MNGARIFFLLLAGGAAAGRAEAAQQANAPPVAAARDSGIAARINGEILTWDDVDLMLRDVPLEQRTAERRRNTLKALATNRLYLQEARKHQVTVTDAQLDEAFRREGKAFKNEEDFLNYITQALNMSVTDYREALRTRILIQRVIIKSFHDPNLRAVLQDEVVSPEEVRAYYLNNPEEFKAFKEIDVIRLALQFQTSEQREEALRLARSILRKLEEGSDLEALVHYYMDPRQLPVDAKGRPIAGYRGLKPNESPFLPETNKLLFETLNVFELSGPVEDKNTINIFRVVRKIDRKEEPFEEAQINIQRRLEQEKRMHNQNALLAELVRRSFIEPPDLFQ
ncbi:MAG: peptidyl-prolyl cis-trans isomerase [Planctomycetes bacterium]|nr:peptidyl-prolyl cis-trans isomerase [Planctomycetota bacterium]